MRLSYEIDGKTYILTGMTNGVCTYKEYTGRK